MKFSLLHPRDQIVTLIERIYGYGMTTTSGGNLSILDENGDIWITPAGVDKGSLRPDDIICVKPDHSVVGPHKPSSEYPFHRSMYEKRKDIRAIVHAHPSALVSFSIARKLPDTRIIPQAHHVCGEVGFAPYALPGSMELGEKIGNTFVKGYNVVLLENHGVVTVGEDLLQAFQRLETLDFCARTIIQSANIGQAQSLNDEQIALFHSRDNKIPTFVPKYHTSTERSLRKVVVEIVHRAYDRHLMTSTEGTASARVDDRSFIISPYGVDRKYMEIEDLVLVQDGCSEEGKIPSRAVRMHDLIYRQHPEIGSIITAQSPNAIIFSVTGKAFDTRTIPESYIILRDIPLIPYGCQCTQPEVISAALSKNTPVLLIQNDAIMTTGANILEAFDRLEVADFSAKSLANTSKIGELVPIGDADIKDIEKAFFK